jgi:hypothetical protein
MVDWDKKKIEIQRTKKRIEQSPDINTVDYVSKNKEEKYKNEYIWPMHPGKFDFLPIILKIEDDYNFVVDGNYDTHLRSIKDVLKYNIRVLDGDIGDVDDFIVSDKSWHIRFLVTKIQLQQLEKNVLISPKWIKKISWNDMKIYLNVKREKIADAPNYDSESPITKEFEQKLKKYYEKLKILV